MVWPSCGPPPNKNSASGPSPTDPLPVFPVLQHIHPKETSMKLSKIVIAAAVVAAGASSVATSALAQAKEQFFPLLSYRTGPYAPNGVPWANGKQDYIKMINARDGGINGVKLTFEECETGYATDRGVECYERLKSRPGVSLFDPQATGITFALTEKAPVDKIPLMTLGYGLSVAQDGQAFKWNFPFMGSYWTGADILIQHIGKANGGLDKLKGKKIALVYHDSPFGKEPIPLLQERAKMHGFELQMLPVTAPGVEQKATWLQVRQSRPDYVLLWCWGVMNSTALKEAQGTGPKDEVGSVLYTRGVIIQMLAVESVRRAQERFGKGKVMTGEQVRWGMENLALDQKKLDALGFGGVMRPLSTSCADHMGSTWARVHTWDGSKWNFSSDWYQADEQILKPMVKAGADKYLADKKMTRRDAADCQS